MIEGKVKPVFKYVGTHMIFDIKIDGKFTCRARLVAGGHNTAPPLFTTYYSVVTRKSVILAFIIAVLNYLDICACVIGKCISQCSLLGKTVDLSRIRIWK